MLKNNFKSLVQLDSKVEGTMALYPVAIPECLDGGSAYR